MGKLVISHALNSLKKLRLAVKSHFLFGVEMVKSRDATTVKSVRTNGSQFVHQALWSLSVMFVLQFVQMEPLIMMEFVYDQVSTL